MYNEINYLDETPDIPASLRRDFRLRARTSSKHLTATVHGVVFALFSKRAAAGGAHTPHAHVCLWEVARP